MHSLRLPTNDPDQVERLCDEGEARLKAGLPLCLEDLVASSQPGRRERLAIELLLLEIDYATRAGAKPHRQEYFSRYPGLGRQVELAFCLLDPDEAGLAEARDALVAFRSGSAFSHYELRERLGSGATCEVWKAVDRMTGREVALKVPQWRQQSIDQRLRFLREGRALSRLRHPGIVTLYELGREANLPYLAIELMEAGTLRELLRKGPLEPRKAAEMCQSIAIALDHAHQRGILHRDIKPGNVLLDADGEPVLTDFGLAKDEQDGGDLTELGDVLGTPAYMAPEQAAGRSSAADARADVYGAGAVLYECLTGVPPARRDAARGGLDPRRLRPSLPRELSAICHKATQKRPDDRYASAGHLTDDLGRFLEGRAVHARFPSYWKRALHRTRSLEGAVSIGFLAVAMPIALIASLRIDDGRREVMVAVDPPSCLVAFVPLREWGANPDLRRATFGKGTRDLRARLTPGRYYVVAVAPDGRFHEVQRVVPAAQDPVIRPGKFRQTSELESGGVRLRPIIVPPADITQSMTLLEGFANYVPGAASSGANDPGLAVASFYIDHHEYTGGSDATQFWTGSYTDAVDAAEQAGKRLPTELEYEFAATACGHGRFPWGDYLPKSLEGGDTAFDRLAPGGDVVGLCTGVAEWTTPLDCLDPSRPSDYAVARGGNEAIVGGDLRPTMDSIDPLCRVNLPETVSQPGVGWRGVRSAAPLIEYEEMR